jgi:hypothetical protein
MTSGRGNTVANQFVIWNDGCHYFQSYDSIIVKVDKSGRTFLDEKYWDYSNTTGKYRNQFLGETKKETQAQIDSGKYVLTDLNNQ